MYKFLSKFLPLFVYPPGLIAGLLVTALIFHHRKRLMKTCLILSLIILFLSGNSWVSKSLVRSLEWRFLPPNELETDSPGFAADVIVLLAGSTHSAQYPRPMVEVNGAGDRVLYAGSLYQRGKASYILLSGGRIDYIESGDSPAQDMASILKMMGINEDAFLYEDHSQNTEESASAAWDILSKRNVDRIILVTSASHMPRSVYLFEQQGFDVIPAPTDYSITQEEWYRLTHPDFETFLLNLLPTASNLAATSSAIKEYLGIFMSWLRTRV